MDELEDLRELRRLVEDLAYWNNPPAEKMVGSIHRYVAAKEAVLRKLQEIQANETAAIQPIRRRI